MAASVDIIVACKGPGAALAATVQSVAGQTAPARLLVADGGSRDGTPDRLARWHDEGLVASWTSQPDQGIYDAWNRALDDVRSDWVMFLGAGDTLADTRVLADLAPEQAHAAAQDTRVVYGQAVLVDAAGTSIETWNRPWPEVASEFHAAMPILHSAVLHHRSLFTEHGRFDPTFSIAGDYEFLLRELPHRPAHSVDRPVVRLLDGGVSRDDRNARQVDTELLRIAHRHDLPQLRRHVRRRRAWRHLNTWLPAPLQGRLLARYRRRRRRRGVHRGDVL